MKTHIIALALCLTAFAAQAQTEYIIDQPLYGRMTEIEVNEGWNVRLIHDTMNHVSIVTPCEHYFTEGNEPEICKLDAGGRLMIWQNKYMPQGTVVEVHYREPIGDLLLNPRASVTADTLLIKHRSDMHEYGDIVMEKRATLTVGHIVSDGGSFALGLDSNATAHVGFISNPYLIKLNTMAGSTLTVDSFDCPEVRYHRNPKSHGNLTESDSTRHLTVKTSNRWFYDGLKILRNTINVAVNNPFTPVSLQYNNPYLSKLELDVIIGLKTNIIPMSQRWGLSLGLDFGIPFIYYDNNSSVNGRVLEIDTTSPGVNRQSFMNYMYLGLPVRLHYRPQSTFGQVFFGDIHLGMEPKWNFGQFYLGSTLEENSSRWDVERSKMSVYSPIQLRADIGFSANMFMNIEINFYVDLLPTYRKETGMGNVHAFGLQMRF